MTILSRGQIVTIVSRATRLVIYVIVLYTIIHILRTLYGTFSGEISKLSRTLGGVSGVVNEHADWVEYIQDQSVQSLESLGQELESLYNEAVGFSGTNFEK